MLEIENVTISYGDLTILDNVNLVVNNTPVILLGPNGSGKTSLIRAISGLIPYKGSIKIKGKEVRNSRGILEYSTNLPEVYTIASTPWEIAKINTELKGGDPNEFLKLVDFLEVDKKVIKRPIYRLSTGQNSLVRLALTLFTEPKIVTLDEPFENVDVKRRNKVLELIKGRVKEGIIVTHDLRIPKLLEGVKVYSVSNGKLVEGIDENI
ncbi:ABC transporter ATPase [Candidatus Acidianus copahuensis]|uniref:ABC transporter ATPase n=1 Tax=Candidatus Acidianus copahuensis TaxID=1160895 RepID=A0A031LX12_9CREN|nr:ATP-binding cassette domain-containing protein [Candidatus Acidianus copahuensis]EZQ12024.1 ABC transporter ATPase [Candidatus Acidianus copahuensis]